MRHGRRPEPSIEDLATHPRRTVCLRVAAEYLELDERAVRARIEDGRLAAVHDGNVYRISLKALARYEATHRRVAS